MTPETAAGHRVSLGEYLACAALAVGADAAATARSCRLSLAGSALAAAWPEFGGEDLRPDPWDKAAALCCALVRNHPLIDGNKRAAWAAMR